MTAGAIVSIGGQTITGTWDGSNLVALDDLTIRWGRDRFTDHAEPSILTARIIDRAGTFITQEERVGQAVTVRIADPARLVFRGTMSAPKAERTRIANPVTGVEETVWIVTIVASDQLAALGMAVLLGTSDERSIEGRGGWTEKAQSLRLEDVFNAGASGIVAAIDPLPTVAVAPRVFRALYAQFAEDAHSALTLIEQVYELSPLGVPQIDAERDAVTVAAVADPSPVALTLAGRTIRLTLPAGHVIPAGSVATLDGRQIESSVSDRIGIVQVGYVRYMADPSMSGGQTIRYIRPRQVIEGRTAAFNPAQRTVLKVDSQAMTYDPAVYGSGWDPNGDLAAANRFPPYLLGALIALLDRLNGLPRIPQITFDAERMPLDALTESIVYRTRSQTIPIMFAGSLFTEIPGVPLQYQIIGGTLTYRGGWRHRVRAAPIAPNAAGSLTVAQIVTRNGPTVGDFDPAISLADLATVATGLA